MEGEIWEELAPQLLPRARKDPAKEVPNFDLNWGSWI